MKPSKPAKRTRKASSFLDQLLRVGPGLAISTPAYDLIAKPCRTREDESLPSGMVGQVLLDSLYGLASCIRAI